MTRSLLRRNIFAISFAGAAALFAAGCGQEGPVDAAPASAGQAVTAVAPRTGNLLAQSDFCDDALSGACTPTGAHGKIAQDFREVHAGYECKECHYVGGRLAFKPLSLGGKAFLTGTGAPRPSFDATAKTCSNIACHYVAPGTFSYYFPGGDGEPVLNTVNYGGGAPRPTPQWYCATVPPLCANSCSACHQDPPRNGSDGSNTWHSGYHGNQGPTGAYNQCQFCHPDASSPGNGIGDTITNAALHANGTVNVQARFTSACFGCH